MRFSHSILICGILTALPACSNHSSEKKGSPQTGYIITGKIKGLSSGTVKLVSRNEEDRTSTTVDSSHFQNDTFELKGILKYPQMLSLVIDSGNWSMPVFAENSTIMIKGDTANAEHFDWRNYGGVQGAKLRNYTIIGSEANNDYEAFRNEAKLKKYEARLMELGVQIDSFMAKNEMTGEHTARGEAALLRNQWRNDQLNYLKEFVEVKPTSVAGVCLLDEIYKVIDDKPVARIDSILDLLKGEARSSVYYAEISATQQKIKSLYPGQQAPDFTLLKRDSSKFTLSSLQGKYVLIDFWASWCLPCRQAIPHWKGLYKKYQNKGFDIVNVSGDVDWKDWFKAMEKEKMTWHQVCDEFPDKYKPATISSLYMAVHIPCYVLIDKQGTILVYSSEKAAVDDKLREIFRG